MARDFFDDKISGAFFSDCRKHRNLLWRIWNDTKPKVAFIGLNPSNADETKPDPTITRVISFAKEWGYGGIYMTNLFTFVSSNPDDLLTCGDAVGEADKWIALAAKQSEKIIFAWGNFKQARTRAEAVAEKYDGYALVLNKNGSPRHPLYVKGSTVPVPFPKKS
jgi:hypothetical protein